MSVDVLGAINQRVSLFAKRQTAISTISPVNWWTVGLQSYRTTSIDTVGFRLKWAQLRIKIRMNTQKFIHAKNSNALQNVTASSFDT